MASSAMSPQLAQAIMASARRIGADPLDLATVISFESGGTFSPSKWGGKNNNHLGLIQFGGPEREKYGAHEGQTAEEQLGAVERYLVDRGFKPGMGRLDLYATVNAGRPGLYNRSDTANGGTPGTVADKVRDQMSGHEEKARMLLGMPGADAPIDNYQPMSAPTVAAGPVNIQSPVQVGALNGTAPAAEPTLADQLKGLGKDFGGGQPGQQQQEQFAPLQQIQLGAARPAVSSQAIAQALAQRYGIV